VISGSDGGDTHHPKADVDEAAAGIADEAVGTARAVSLARAIGLEAVDVKKTRQRRG
jgi:hypothetical protein